MAYILKKDDDDDDVYFLINYVDITSLL